MAINLFNEFGTDAKAEIEGAWISYGGDAKFLIARFGNTKFKRAMSDMWKKSKNVLETKPGASDAVLDAADAAELNIKIECYSKFILLGWSGVDAEYSVAAAREALKIKDFCSWVETQAMDFKNFKAAELEEEAGK